MTAATAAVRYVNPSHYTNTTRGTTTTTAATAAVRYVNPSHYTNTTRDTTTTTAATAAVRYVNPSHYTKHYPGHYHHDCCDCRCPVR